MRTRNWMLEIFLHWKSEYIIMCSNWAASWSYWGHLTTSDSIIYMLIARFTHFHADHSMRNHSELVHRDFRLSSWDSTMIPQGLEMTSFTLFTDLNETTLDHWQVQTLFLMESFNLRLSFHWYRSDFEFKPSRMKDSEMRQVNGVHIHLISWLDINRSCEVWFGIMR